MKLVLASNNPGKLAELRVLLAPLALDLVAQGNLEIPEAEEPHATFLENALVKARHAARASGGAAIADDSGLVVDALDGAPGVFSAHYAPIEVVAGEPREALRKRQDAANIAHLLEQLKIYSNRRARFVATLVAVRHERDPEPLVAVGRWHGVLLDAPRGGAGFGYDPLLYIPAFGKTVAELEPAEKNAASHRALAAWQMLGLMRDAWLPG